MDLGSCPLGDVFDVAAVAALHEEVVLGSDVQVGGDGDGAGQAAGQVLQQQSGSPLGRRGDPTGRRNESQVVFTSGNVLPGTALVNSQCGGRILSNFITMATI